MIFFSLVCACGFFWIVKSVCVKTVRESLTLFEWATVVILASILLGCAVFGVTVIEGAMSGKLLGTGSSSFTPPFR